MIILGIYGKKLIIFIKYYYTVFFESFSTDVRVNAVDLSDILHDELVFVDFIAC